MGAGGGGVMGDEGGKGGRGRGNPRTSHRPLLASVIALDVLKFHC